MPRRTPVRELQEEPINAINSPLRRSSRLNTRLQQNSPATPTRLRSRRSSASDAAASVTTKPVKTRRPSFTDQIDVIVEEPSTTLRLPTRSSGTLSPRGRSSTGNSPTPSLEEKRGRRGRKATSVSPASSATSDLSITSEKKRSTELHNKDKASEEDAAEKEAKKPTTRRRRSMSTEDEPLKTRSSTKKEDKDEGELELIPVKKDLDLSIINESIAEEEVIVKENGDKDGKLVAQNSKLEVRLERMSLEGGAEKKSEEQLLSTRTNNDLAKKAIEVESPGSETSDKENSSIKINQTTSEPMDVDVSVSFLDNIGKEKSIQQRKSLENDEENSMLSDFVDTVEGELEKSTSRKSAEAILEKVGKVSASEEEFIDDSDKSGRSGTNQQSPKKTNDADKVVEIEDDIEENDVKEISSEDNEAKVKDTNSSRVKTGISDAEFIEIIEEDEKAIVEEPDNVQEKRNENVDVELVIESSSESTEEKKNQARDQNLLKDKHVEKKLTAEKEKKETASKKDETESDTIDEERAANKTVESKELSIIEESEDKKIVEIAEPETSSINCSQKSSGVEDDVFEAATETNTKNTSLKVTKEEIKSKSEDLADQKLGEDTSKYNTKEASPKITEQEKRKSLRRTSKSRIDEEKAEDAALKISKGNRKSITKVENTTDDITSAPSATTKEARKSSTKASEPAKDQADRDDSFKTDSAKMNIEDEEKKITTTTGRRSSVRKSSRLHKDFDFTAEINILPFDSSSEFSPEEKQDLEDKIDDLLSKVNNDEEKEEEEIESREIISEGEEEGGYIIEMAEEGEEGTPSENSDEIIDDGESLGSMDSDDPKFSDDEEEKYESSFIDSDDEPHDLLPGNEYDLSFDSPKKSKIVDLNEIDDDTDIIELDKSEKKKKKKEEPKKRSRIITPKDSSDDEAAVEIVEEVAVVHAPNIEVSGKRSRKSSIVILENISVDEIQNQSLADKINEVIDQLYPGIKEKGADVSVNVSLDYGVSSPVETLTEEAKVQQDANEQVLEDMKQSGKKKKQQIETPISAKKGKQRKSEITEIKADDKLAITPKKKKKKKERTENIQSPNLEKVKTPIISPVEQKPTPKAKKKKTQKLAKADISDENIITSKKKKKKNLVESAKEKIKTPLKESESANKLKKRASNESFKSPAKKSKTEKEEKASRKRKLEETPGWNKKRTKFEKPELADAATLAGLLNQKLNKMFGIEKRKKKIKQRLQYMPSVSQNTEDWSVNIFHVKPSTSNVRKTDNEEFNFHPKDFKNQTLFDSSRKRVNRKQWLKKQTKTSTM